MFVQSTIRFMCSLILLFSIASCTSRTPIPGSKIDRSYSVGGYRWNSGLQVLVFYKVFNSNGQVAVCGAWATRGGGSVSRADVGLGVGVVNLGGSRILQGIDFMQGMSEIDSPKGVFGKPTNCISTSVAWTDSFDSAEAVLRFPRMRVPG